jgi:hypothetical protein
VCIVAEQEQKKQAMKPEIKKSPELGKEERS